MTTAEIIYNEAYMQARIGTVESEICPFLVRNMLPVFSDHSKWSDFVARLVAAAYLSYHSRHAALQVTKQYRWFLSAGRNVATIWIGGSFNPNPGYFVPRKMRLYHAKDITI